VIDPTGTESWIAIGLAALLGYALGCLNTGYLLVRWKTGRDLRTLGSGNAGARNAGRILGRSGFVLTMLGDMLKGALAVGSALLWLPTPFATASALIAVVAGHLWPAPLGFRGGKGAATGCAAALIYAPASTSLALLVCLLIFLCTRRATLSAMIAFSTLPLFAWILTRDPLVSAALAIVAALVVSSHRLNLAHERSHT